MSQVQGTTGVSGGTPAPVAVQPTSTNPATAGNIAQANGVAADSSTTVSSMAELRKKSPKVYNMIVESLGRKICSDMREHQERLKRKMSQ